MIFNFIIESSTAIGISPLIVTPLDANLFVPKNFFCDLMWWWWWKACGEIKYLIKEHFFLIVLS